MELKSQEEYNRKRSSSREDSMRFWMKKADAQRRQLVLLKEQCETGNLDKVSALRDICALVDRTGLEVLLGLTAKLQLLDSNSGWSLGKESLYVRLGGCQCMRTREV